jgi:peptidoglycan/xylan/chitin deacetylase (PgdA/CDA1 family)
MSKSFENPEASAQVGAQGYAPPVMVPVIQYHMIDRPSSNSRVRGGFTPPERFSRQMAYLKSHGFKFYTAAELIDHYQSDQQFPRSAITITFDDGCRDNYTNAFPVLRELGIKATMFVVPSCIGETTAKPLAMGEEPRPHMTREEILEMSRHGIEFGSHTMNHRLLHQIPLADVKEEVQSAKRFLEDFLQHPCKTFAYPAGYCNSEVEQIIKEAGHTCAFSTIHGPKDRIDLYAINRVEILRRDRFLFQFARKVKPFAG